MSMDGMTMEDKCERLEPCGMGCEQVKQCNYRPHAGVLKSAFCARLRRVIHVIVHNGLTDVGSVLVVVHTFS